MQISGIRLSILNQAKVSSRNNAKHAKCLDSYAHHTGVEYDLPEADDRKTLAVLLLDLPRLGKSILLQAWYLEGGSKSCL